MDDEDGGEFEEEEAVVDQEEAVVDPGGEVEEPEGEEPEEEFEEPDFADGAAARSQGSSSKDSLKQAANHFNIFLKKFLAKYPQYKRLFGVTDINNVDFLKFTNEQIAAIDAKVMDHFAKYLGEDAKSQRVSRVNGNNLSYESCSRYLSAIKTAITNKLIYGAPWNVSEETMKKIRRGMCNIVILRCISRQVRVQRPREHHIFLQLFYHQYFNNNH